MKADYTWNDVRNAVDIILRDSFSSKIEGSIVKKVYNNNLPQGIKEAGFRMFMNVSLLEKHSDEADLIRRAYTQLNDDGYIGNKN